MGMLMAMTQTRQRKVDRKSDPVVAKEPQPDSAEAVEPVKQETAKRPGRRKATK